jgi:hypothetical protein
MPPSAPADRPSCPRPSRCIRAWQKFMLYRQRLSPLDAARGDSAVCSRSLAGKGLSCSWQSPSQRAVWCLPIVFWHHRLSRVFSLRAVSSCFLRFSRDPARFSPPCGSHRSLCGMAAAARRCWHSTSSAATDFTPRARIIHLGTQATEAHASRRAGTLTFRASAPTQLSAAQLHTCTHAHRASHRFATHGRMDHCSSVAVNMPCCRTRSDVDAIAILHPHLQAATRPLRERCCSDSSAATHAEATGDRTNAVSTRKLITPLQNNDAFDAQASFRHWHSRCERAKMHPVPLLPHSGRHSDSSVTAAPKQLQCIVRHRGVIAQLHFRSPSCIRSSPSSCRLCSSCPTGAVHGAVEPHHCSFMHSSWQLLRLIRTRKANYAKRSARSQLLHLRAASRCNALCSVPPNDTAQRTATGDSTPA